MKSVLLAIFALVIVSGTALADWNNPPPPPGWGPGHGPGPGPGPGGPGWGPGGPGGPGHGPGWGPPPPPPHWGTCTVLFKKCDFAINGFCVKWNNKGFQINRRDYYYGCQMAANQYGEIRDCRITCP